MMRGLESCVWRRSFTRSMGATTVLEIPPETPPARRSITKGGRTPVGSDPEAAAKVLYVENIYTNRQEEGYMRLRISHL